MLEAMQHTDNVFLTLTYADNRLPLTENGSSTLRPLDAQLWLKRIREAIAPLRLRFYLVGEYGDESFRPHYHAVLFGVAPCQRGGTLRCVGSTRPNWSECCWLCKLVGETWGYGDVDCRAMDDGLAQYISGYVTKKMTRFDDPRLGGRHPEFARMSLKPGLGSDAMYEVASQLMKYGLDDAWADVPSVLASGKKLMPLGRYLRRRLRVLLGKNPAAPEAALAAMAEEVRDVFEATRLAPTPELKKLAFKNALIDADTQRMDSLENRLTLYKQKRSV